METFTMTAKDCKSYVFDDVSIVYVDVVTTTNIIREKADGSKEKLATFKLTNNFDVELATVNVGEFLKSSMVRSGVSVKCQDVIRQKISDWYWSWHKIENDVATETMTAEEAQKSFPYKDKSNLVFMGIDLMTETGRKPSKAKRTAEYNQKLVALCSDVTIDATQRTIKLRALQEEYTDLEK